MLLDNYDMVVVRPWYSKFYLPDNPNALKDPSRTEVLINQTCIPNCFMELEHYTWAENKRVIDDNKNFKSCPRLHFKSDRVYDTKVHSDELIKKLITDCKIKHLKLHGRGLNKIPEFLIYEIGLFLLHSTGFGIIEDTIGFYNAQALPLFQKEVLSLMSTPAKIY